MSEKYWKSFQNRANLQEHIRAGVPSLYLSSRTSTVIPYERIEKYLDDVWREPFLLCRLDALPERIELSPANNLVVEGPVTWRDARAYLRSQGRDIKTAPTEELAAVLGGVCTSATGERCFAFGNLRGQIVSLRYLDHNGDERELKRENPFQNLLPAAAHQTLRNYQNDFSIYQNFKNAPYPRFERETDLMIGAEGQLGVVIAAELETVAETPVRYFFLQLPRWEENNAAHLEILDKVQPFRGRIVSCEMIDSNSWAYLEKEERLGDGQDIIFLEILEKHLDDVYENFLSTLTTVPETDIFEISETSFHHLRATTPRAIFEENQRQGVVKTGTDIQVTREVFPELLESYRAATQLGVDYVLFGHFGDAHLHFNFMPTPENLPRCQEFLEKLYKQVRDWRGSPFAEHGVGLLKQKFMAEFYGDEQRGLFQILKDEFDPKRQFFPQGFMSGLSVSKF